MRIRRRHVVVRITAFAASAVVVLLMQGPTAMAAEPPSGIRVLLVGDSVPYHLAGTLAARLEATLGWELVSASIQACSVYGDSLAWPDGTPKGDPDHCPSKVIPAQRDAVTAFDPDVVLWWDRLSTMPVLTPEGEFVSGGTNRFWELRGRSFDETFARLSAGGATIVFVAAEPIGIGVHDLCAGSRLLGCTQWRQYRIDHYDDITRPENRRLRAYAESNPGTAVWISITDTICRWNNSPCNDRMPNGDLARPDGTHYEGRGENRASYAIIRDMVRALYG
jgi:hypothetical protein